MRFTAIVFLILAMAACSRLTPPPQPGPTAAEPPSRETALKAWSRLLETHVDRYGRVAFEKLWENPDDLHIFIRYIAAVSPEKFPNRFSGENQKLAYHINAYNALAMYGVLQNGIPGDLYSWYDRGRFFWFQQFTLGDREISLLDYENEVIRPLRDPRVHFALNCMTFSCPRLPQSPFTPENLPAQLDESAREFINHPRHIQPDWENEEVEISQIFEFYEEDFVNPREARSLLDYINRYRERPIPEHFEVDFIPHNWTLKKQ